MINATQNPKVTTYCPTCFDTLGCEDDSTHGAIVGVDEATVTCAHCDFWVMVYVDGKMVSDRDSYNEPNACSARAYRAVLAAAGQAVA